jgi:hypothetical protein
LKNLGGHVDKEGWEVVKEAYWPWLKNKNDLNAGRYTTPSVKVTKKVTT